jgi:hypothetical protein
MCFLDTFSIHAGIEEKVNMPFFSGLAECCDRLFIIDAGSRSMRVVGEIIVWKGFSEDEGFFLGIITDNLVFWEAIDSETRNIRIFEDSSNFFESMAVGI